MELRCSQIEFLADMDDCWEKKKNNLQRSLNTKNHLKNRISQRKLPVLMCHLYLVCSCLARDNSTDITTVFLIPKCL